MNLSGRELVDTIPVMKSNCRPLFSSSVLEAVVKRQNFKYINYGAVNGTTLGVIFLGGHISLKIGLIAPY
jgi:hypothetical protein